MSQQTNEHLKRLRDAAARAITEDDVRDLMQSLMKRAKAGEREATRVMLAYLSPPPDPAPPAPRIGPINIRPGRHNGPRRPVRMIEHDGGNGQAEGE